MIDLGKVAVLGGGASAERQVSLRSAQAVVNGLQAAGVDAHFVDPTEYNVMQLPQDGFKRAFIALHGRGGEDGHMQALLGALQIPYTGSGVLACALAMDKARTKYLWRGMGLPTAGAAVVERSMLERTDFAAVLGQLGGAVMVKPSQEGSSVGMARASSAAELRDAVTHASQYDESVLVESWLPGAEYTVSILDDTALPAIQVRTPHEFYDYAAKYEDTTTEYLCPAGLNDIDEAALGALALRAFAAVGGRGWGRVDFKQDAAGQMQLLEVNMVPGMTEKSLVPMAAKQYGLSFSQLVVNILTNARV